MRTVFYRLSAYIGGSHRALAAVGVGLVLTIPVRGWADVSLVSASDSRVVFEIDLTGYQLQASRYLAGAQVLTVPGFGSLALPGQAMVPGADFLVAIPEGATATATASVLASTPLGSVRLEPAPFPVVVRDDDGSPSVSQDVRIDPEIYDAAPSAVTVRAQTPQRLRRQWVVPVRVTPLTYNPLTGEAVLATRIQVSVSVSGGGRPGFFGSTGGGVVDDVTWERIYARSLINPEQGKAWRVKLQRPQFDARSAAVLDATAGPLVKLKVFSDGMHRVRASTVIAKGFPAAMPIASLRVFKRGYDRTAMMPLASDVAHLVVEDGAGQAGVFDGNDVVVFFGQRLMNDAMRDAPLEKFSDHNIYWLGSTPGTTMTTKTVGTASVRSDTASATYARSDYYESDFLFFEDTPPNVRDFYYFNSALVSEYRAPFTVQSPVPGGTFTITMEIMGGDHRDASAPNRDVLLGLPATQTALTPVRVTYKNVVEHTTAPVTNAALVPGVNTFHLVPPPGRSVLVAVLNWFRVEYDALYRTSGNVLEFTNGGRTGSTDLSVIGLSRNNLMLFDVTDPVNPQNCALTAAHFVPAGNGFVLAFNSNFAGSRRLVATPVDKMTEVVAANVIGDEPSSIIGNPAEAGVDILVVSHVSFLSEMQRWVDYRRSQGYRVLMVDQQEVMDEFNGGVTDPRAIRDCIKRFFAMGNASFVVLVGDNSEDTKRVHIESPPAFVPSESYTEHVFGGGFDEDEVVTTDKWYVMLDYDFIHNEPPNALDFFPDLIIGRIPAGNVTELRTVIDKTIKFEAPKGDEFWRRRIIRVADDAWSGGSVLQYVPAERGFEDGERVAAQKIEASFPGGFDIIRFWMSDRIGHPPINQQVSAFSQASRTRIEATPVLIGELNKGASWVSISAHMNRYLICHEFLFTSSIATPDGSPRDYLRLKNNGRPWVIFGMGCHFSDYAVHKELARTTTNGPQGDALAELFLHVVDAGAVGTYGSSGFEYLNTEQRHTEILCEETFVNTPTDNIVGTNKAQARWIFGELMTQSEITNLNRYANGGPGNGAWGQALRMHVLGDPLLRIDGGPPRFQVTVDGVAVENDEFIFGASATDSITVEAIVTDEVAIEDLELEIAGEDASSTLTVTPLNDTGLTAARQYRVTFKHRIVPATYDIVIRASQAENTSGGYHMSAEFVLKVAVAVVLTANGRTVISGDVVPGKADFIFEIATPVPVDPGLVTAKVDDELVAGLSVTAGDTTTTASFSADLSVGRHALEVFVDQDSYRYDVIVSNEPGLSDVVPYPNPFVDDTYFIYTNNLPISNGTIDIFTVSGKKVMGFDIPFAARGVGQNTVHWDGRTWSGDEIANGVYLFVVRVTQEGKDSIHRGRLVRAK